MIIIGPGALILIALLAFRPIRRIIGLLLFILLCAGVRGCMMGG